MEVLENEGIKTLITYDIDYVNSNQGKRRRFYKDLKDLIEGKNSIERINKSVLLMSSKDESKVKKLFKNREYYDILKFVVIRGKTPSIRGNGFKNR